MSRQSDYDAGYYAEVARQVSKGLSRDAAIKQRLLARNPGLAFSLDAGEAEAMSGVELATRELKELGITAKNSDPIELLDVHHMGRAFARHGGRSGGGMDGAADSFIDRYLKE